MNTPKETLNTIFDNSENIIDLKTLLTIRDKAVKLFYEYDKISDDSRSFHIKKSLALLANSSNDFIWTIMTFYGGSNFEKVSKFSKLSIE